MNVNNYVFEIIRMILLIKAFSSKTIFKKLLKYYEFYSITLFTSHT